MVFSRDGKSPNLRQPWGAWNGAMHLNEWEVLYSGISGKAEVFCRQPNGEFKVYADTVATRGKHTSISSAHSGRVNHVPLDSVPASFGPLRKDGRQRVSWRPQVDPSKQTSDETVMTFSDFVQSQTPHIQILLQHSDLTDATAERIARHLQGTNSIDCGTDGGLPYGRGTFGFAWADHTTRTILATGKGIVPGYDEGMSSTRAELCGIFAALTYLRLVKLHYHMAHPHEGTQRTIMYCDSKAALKRISDLSYDGFGTTWRCRANYDFESAIRACLQGQRSTVSWIWVKGHAARRKKRQEFTWAETLNDCADCLATAASEVRQRPDQSHWPDQQVSIDGPGGRISGRLDKAIRYCCTSRDLMSYWQQRFGWTKPQLQSMDIVGTRAAAKNFRPEAAQILQKLRCGWLPVNNRESRSDPDRLSGCSACSTTNLVPETVDHVFQCTAASRRKAIIDQFATFADHFRNMKTSQLLISAMQMGALAWIEQRDPPSVELLRIPNNTMGGLIRQAYIEQSALGWNVFFRGFWSQSWRLAQEEQFRMYQCRDSQDNGTQWAARAQTWFYNIFLQVWKLRNNDEHGDNPATQRAVRLSKCHRSIVRLYEAGNALSYADRHPFRDSMEDLLLQPVTMQELWITKTEGYLRGAHNRQRDRTHCQPAITNFFTRLHG